MKKKKLQTKQKCPCTLLHAIKLPPQIRCLFTHANYLRFDSKLYPRHRSWCFLRACNLTYLSCRTTVSGQGTQQQQHWAIFESPWDFDQARGEKVRSNIMWLLLRLCTFWVKSFTGQSMFCHCATAVSVGGVSTLLWLLGPIAEDLMWEQDALNEVPPGYIVQWIGPCTFEFVVDSHHHHECGHNSIQSFATSIPATKQTLSRYIRSSICLRNLHSRSLQESCARIPKSLFST